jgi:hypothetical protein
MKKTLALAGMGFALCSTVAFADPDPTLVPAEKAAAVVGEKTAANPENRGLANALRHILKNITRFEQKHETADRAERPDRVDRAGVDRPGPERVAAHGGGRPDAPGRVKH